jgi:hypothetical protein
MMLLFRINSLGEIYSQVADNSGGYTYPCLPVGVSACYFVDSSLAGANLTVSRFYALTLSKDQKEHTLSVAQQAHNCLTSPSITSDDYAPLGYTLPHQERAIRGDVPEMQMPWHSE